MACLWGIFSGVMFVTLLMGYIFKRAVRPSPVKSIDRKHVFITGGSSGIGKSIAMLSASMGADVTICGRNHDKLDAALAEITKHAKYPEKQKISKVSLDVTANYDTIEKALTESDNENPIYMLVNCAGIAICGTVEDTTDKDLDHMMKLNFLGTFNCIKALTPKMKSRREGIVVLTSSQAGLVGIYGMAAYCSTKFALRGLAESLSFELYPYDISVTLCLPPDTDTPGFEIEELNKPEETKLISSTAKLVHPDIVAEALLDDALGKKFFSVVGLEGFMLSVLCSGMSPIMSKCELFIQVTLMGLFRFVSMFYFNSFLQIVTDCTKKRDELKKIE